MADTWYAPLDETNRRWVERIGGLQRLIDAARKVADDGFADRLTQAKALLFEAWKDDLADAAAQEAGSQG